MITTALPTTLPTSLPATWTEDTSEELDAAILADRTDAARRAARSAADYTAAAQPSDRRDGHAHQSGYDPHRIVTVSGIDERMMTRSQAHERRLLRQMRRAA
jgi:hypothetical protein